MPAWWSGFADLATSPMTSRTRRFSCSLPCRCPASIPPARLHDGLASRRCSCTLASTLRRLCVWVRTQCHPGRRDSGPRHSCGSACTEVTFTGHSLGSAMTTRRRAVDFQAHQQRRQLQAAGGGGAPARAVVSNLFTFGSPRVGNEAFAAWASGLLDMGLSSRVTRGSHERVTRCLASHPRWCPCAAGIGTSTCTRARSGTATTQYQPEPRGQRARLARRVPRGERGG